MPHGTHSVFAGRSAAGAAVLSPCNRFTVVFSSSSNTNVAQSLLCCLSVVLALLLLPQKKQRQKRQNPPRQGVAASSANQHSSCCSRLSPSSSSSSKYNCRFRAHNLASHIQRQQPNGMPSLPVARIAVCDTACQLRMLAAAAAAAGSPPTQVEPDRETARAGVVEYACTVPALSEEHGSCTPLARACCGAMICDLATCTYTCGGNCTGELGRQGPWLDVVGLDRQCLSYIQ